MVVTASQAEGKQYPATKISLCTQVKLLSPGAMPKRGKGGTLASRQALLHSLVHIENWAIDLSWDIIARFGVQQAHYCLPKAFFDDFVQVSSRRSWCMHVAAPKAHPCSVPAACCRSNADQCELLVAERA
jgi:uncharacterized ferritin-like protein (DUF455 family)